MSKLKVGITGSTGFLGKRLIEFLKGHNVEIFCLMRPTSGQVDQKTFEGCRIIYGDLKDPGSLRYFIRHLDVCVHLATLSGFADYQTAYEINVQSVKYLTDMIMAHNPSCRFINCSSIASLRVKKEMNLEHSNYALTKKLADDYVEEMQAKGLKSMTFYPGLIFGPGDERFIPVTLKYLENKMVFLLSGGEKNSPMIYVDDLCAHFIKAIFMEEFTDKNVICIGPQDMGMHEFIKAVAEKCQLPVPEKVYPKRPALWLAIILEKAYSMAGRKKAPVISKRVVDIFSLSFSPEEFKDYGTFWKARTTIKDGLEKYFCWRNGHNEMPASKAA